MVWQTEYVWARWRTMHELGIVATFIAENGEDASKGYFVSAQSTNVYYERARSLPCFNNYNSNGSITFDSIYQKYKNVKKHYKQIYNKASVTVQACAEGTFSSFGGNGVSTNGIRAEIYGGYIPAIYVAESLTIVI